MDGDKTMNTKTANSKEIFTKSIGYQVKGQRKTTKRTPEPCPISEFDAKLLEYQTILEEEKVLSDRKKAIKKWALKECLALEEEGEATTISSSDEQMTFSIRRDKTYQFHPWVEALIAAQKRSAIDLSAEKKKAILKGEAEELSCTKVVVFKGPKIK